MAELHEFFVYFVAELLIGDDFGFDDCLRLDLAD